MSAMIWLKEALVAKLRSDEQKSSIRPIGVDKAAE